jgi:hypothetical protein
MLLLLALAAGLTPPRARAQEPKPGFDPDRDPALRWVVDESRRIGLVTGIREARPGRLQLTVGPAFAAGMVEHKLKLFYVAYAAAHPEYDGPVVLELYRGRSKIGEYTTDGLSLVTQPPAAVPPATVNDIGRREALRLFIDCGGCDYDFLRDEITFVNHVRDRHAAQVVALITTQETGGGGTEFTVELVGQSEFKGTDDSLRYVTRAADSEDRVRHGLADALKRGLVRYANHTPFAEQIEVTYATPAGAEDPSLPRRDPWDYWAFGTTLNGSVNGEKSFTYISLNAAFSANRTTEAWKIIASVQGRYSENRVALSDGSTITTVSRDYGADLLLVKSLGSNWAAGVTATLTSSTFLNQRLTGRVAPAVEFNLFPYTEATRREFTIQYSVGATAFDYAEETIFGKTSETLLDQRLLASLAVTRPWGSASMALEGAFYLHDSSKRRGIALGNLDLNLFGGFSLSILGSAEFVRDQIYLSREDASDEDILLRQRQLATSFRYSTSIGFRYTFGSPFANIVNARFGGSTGGMPIIR